MIYCFKSFGILNKVWLQLLNLHFCVPGIQLHVVLPIPHNLITGLAHPTCILPVLVVPVSIPSHGFFNIFITFIFSSSEVNSYRTLKLIPSTALISATTSFPPSNNIGFCLFNSKIGLCVFIDKKFCLFWIISIANILAAYVLLVVR